VTSRRAGLRQLANAAALFVALVVVDGDTVKLDGRSYRLLVFDTPETYFARCESHPPHWEIVLARGLRSGSKLEGQDSTAA
jgi:hypothetical protein